MPKLLLSSLFAALLSLPQFALATSRTVSLNVPTMDCATCPITIKAALLKVPGVTQAKVSYERREAVVVFDDSKTGVDELKKATSDAGYPSMLKSAPK
ncbi:mercury resistance system periplasmic binding protein MerP [Noviherbaspirillum sp. UKPF54]|uniref:mercury resistance system periplasmic binding protein MerP n=1 Tax=Noviherbaspirillum sp. UKPF54 TaxID=2601898 RepID=UPI0011B13BCD|nr:mercury resistance system periplasmic binding protein MerP [Noviherbaspirillum sp. UKPF54]QDZ27891.1 mercury resistance system periplasmic binding protein MerP [Noviherbaspirillum sp. UKPF54]